MPEGAAKNCSSSRVNQVSYISSHYKKTAQAEPKMNPLLARLILIRAFQARFLLCWWCHAQQIHIRLMTNFKRARVCKLKVYETFVRDCTKLVVVVACQWDTNTAEFEWNHNTTKAPNHRKTIPVWDWQVDRSLKIKLCDFSAVFLSSKKQQTNNM